jgi:hypothetical protein
VDVSPAHWAEAAKAVGDDKKKQESYLKAEASQGVMLGCAKHGHGTCNFGAAASLTYNGDSAKVTAMCNRDPRTKW